MEAISGGVVFSLSANLSAFDLPITGALALLAVLAAILAAGELLGLRYIANHQVGIVEKLWSSGGSVPEGSMIALSGEAGYEADVLRGGFHFGLWRWQYRLHRVRLVAVPQGKIGYVYSRDGEPLQPSQTLGRVIECNNFQDAETFLAGDGETAPRGQRGRQRAVLREGVYAINLALFTVITEHEVCCLSALRSRQEAGMLKLWQEELRECDGFSPVVIGAAVESIDPLNPEELVAIDSIGIVTIHDGPSLAPGEIIAPPVAVDRNDPNFHNNYQDPEAFLRAGGRRGRQYVPLTDGTYFINRWFATLEIIPKTVVPIGYVGVVVSYYGQVGRDVSGALFRHGERVAEGDRGVWERPLGPGKYPFNTSAGVVILVPTTNFVLHWVTGKSENHRYDESLRSIDLVTRDAYEAALPLSVVVHIDYQKAPNVIQRFGDVKKLITQTLDPMLSAFFRDIAHKKTMLQLLHERDTIQVEAREELRDRFREFDIECVDVLIGKPATEAKDGKIETLLEQLRLRQLSIEQIETFEHQRAAADKQRSLNEAQAQAAKQAELTNSRVQVQITENQGEADLARARKQAEQTVVVAEAELARARRQAEQTLVTAEAVSQQQVLAGRGEAQRAMQIGLAEASVLLRKISSFGDPRLYALSLVTEDLANSKQPLVPEKLFVAAGGDGANAHGGIAGQGLIGTLLQLLVAEKSGFQPADGAGSIELEEFANRLTRDAMTSLNLEAPAVEKA